MTNDQSAPVVSVSKSKLIYTSLTFVEIKVKMNGHAIITTVN